MRKKEQALAGSAPNMFRTCSEYRPDDAVLAASLSPDYGYVAHSSCFTTRP